MQYDLIVIGSGPAGYVGAIRAGQTGLKTLVIDKRYVGGMCLNWGCIPSKTWLESARLYHKISRRPLSLASTESKPISSASTGFRLKSVLPRWWQS